MEQSKTLGQKIEINLEFKRDKETKNTIRYKEFPDDDVVIGSLYIQKSSLPEDYPEKVKVKVTIDN